MNITHFLYLLIFFTISCAPNRFLVEEQQGSKDPQVYLSEIKHHLVIDKQIKGKLSKESSLGYFESDSSYYSPFETSQVELQKGYYTLQLNSLVSGGMKKPFMFPLVRVFGLNNEEIEVEIIQNRLKGSTFSLPHHIKTFWKIKNPVDQKVKIVVYADRTPMDQDHRVTHFIVAPSVPLILPFQTKSIKVPFGRYRMKVVLFHPDHYHIKRSKL